MNDRFGSYITTNLGLNSCSSISSSSPPYGRMMTASSGGNKPKSELKSSGMRPRSESHLIVDGSRSSSSITPARAMRLYEGSAVATADMSAGGRLVVVDELGSAGAVPPLTCPKFPPFTELDLNPQC